MASGDKIYLADKASVDAVGTKVDNVKTVVDSTKLVVDSTKSSVETTKSGVATANTTLNSLNSRLGSTSDAAGNSSVFSILKTIDNGVKSISTPIGSSREYFTVDDIVSNKLVLKSSDIPSQRSTLLSINGSGLLYAVAFYLPHNSSANAATFFTVKVDGKIIADRSVSHNANYPPTVAGYLCRDGFVVLPNSLTLPGNDPSVDNFSVNLLLRTGVTTGEVSVNGNELLYTPKPIRFNSSVEVTGSSTSSSIKVCYMYELD